MYRNGTNYYRGKELIASTFDLEKKLKEWTNKKQLN
jgi:hypothetical protein